MVGEAFFLGLSTGTFCIISCAPVAIPFLFSEEISGPRQNSLYVVLLLLGRLVSYLAVGALIGALGGFTVKYIDPGLQRILSSVAYIFIGLMLVVTGIMYNFPGLKPCAAFRNVYSPKAGAFIFGVLTGLSLCPPFFAAASRVFGSGSSLTGMLYFTMFFLGTSVYFAPLFGIHLLKRYLPVFRMISRMAMVLLGVYFLFAHGILTIIGGRS